MKQILVIVFPIFLRHLVGGFNPAAGQGGGLVAETVARAVPGAGTCMEGAGCGSWGAGEDEGGRSEW